MSKHCFAAGVALAGLLCVGDAAAAVFTVTYKGAVGPGDYSYDTYDTFGVGAGFVGSDFTLTYTIDTGTPGVGVGASSVWYHTIEGVGLASPVKGAFTIGTKTVLFGADYGSDERYDRSLEPGCTGCTEAGMSQYAFDRIDDFNKNLYTSYYAGASATAYGYGGQFGGLAHVPTGSYDEDNGGSFYGNFALFSSVYDYDTGASDTSADVSASLRIRSVTVAAVPVTVSAAPEPGTWALMILGFGLVGASLRRRVSAQRAYARSAG